MKFCGPVDTVQLSSLAACLQIYVVMGDGARLAGTAGHAACQRQSTDWTGDDNKNSCISIGQ